MITTAMKLRRTSLSVGIVMLMSGCLDSGGSSSGNSDDDSDRPSEYTADLSVFGPHPESSAKPSVSEPRYVSLSGPEREKIGDCTIAREANSISAALLIAGAEIKLDALARLEGVPRTVPFGQAAEEAFYERIAEMVDGQRWPTDVTYGSDLAETIANHYGYKHWEEWYQISSLDMSEEDRTARRTELTRELREEIWPICIEKIPTECFEAGEIRSECTDYAIDIRNLPKYEQVSEIYEID